MKRYLTDEIQSILPKKMVLLSGPRQVGKTTLAKSLTDSFEYLNYDRIPHRKKIIKEEWNREEKLLILDEIHKMKKWKLWLKGLYDTDISQEVIVTGSAKMDTHKRVGDSMAGRYFQYQLFPLDLKELSEQSSRNTEENFNNLMELSGFPEPFFSDSQSYYRKWRRTHLDVILKQDLMEQESIRRISDLSTLVELMTDKIGSLFSYKSLSEDLQTDDKTIKRWMLALENSYVFFKITPFSKNIKSSIKKAPKYYFYDFPRVTNESARLENFVALSLYKETCYRNEVLGENYSLHYLRDNNQNELDFIITKEKIPIVAIEVKSSDHSSSKSFTSFDPYLLKQNPKITKIQLVRSLSSEYSTRAGVKILKLAPWLEKMPFT